MSATAVAQDSHSDRSVFIPPAETPVLISATLTLGPSQGARVIQYTSARLAGSAIVYTAKVDGVPCTVRYEFSAGCVRVFVDGKFGPATEYSVCSSGANPDMKEVALGVNGVYHNITWLASAKTMNLKVPTGTNPHPFSIAVLCHLPTEVKGIRPAELFAGWVAAREAGSGMATGVTSTTGTTNSGATANPMKALDIFGVGIKLRRDCETTKTGKIYVCSAGCTEAAEPGKCSCQMCGEFCCGGSCTITEESTTRNCSGAAEIET